MKFNDEMSSLFDQMGQGSMTGKVFAYLLTCEPAVQSAHQIQQATNCSAGSTHKILQSFLLAGIVQRKSNSGSKKLWYQINANAFVNMLSARMELVNKLLEVTEIGLIEANNKGIDDTRLKAMKHCYGFFAEKFPEMISQYKQSLP